MQKFAPLFLATLLLSACGTSGSQAENAGNAMAETACLLFDESVSFDQITDKTGEIMTAYGWDKPEDIDTYLASIQSNTEELELVRSTAATKLTETCGDALSTSGMTAEDLAESMTQQ